MTAKTPTPTKSLKGLNLRLTRAIYGYAGGEVVSANALAAARAEFEYARTELGGEVSASSFCVGTEYMILRHVAADLILEDWYYTFDQTTRTVTAVAHIAERCPKMIFDGTYHYRY